MTDRSAQEFLHDLDRTLWAADRLRASLDAAVYKRAVLDVIVREFTSGTNFINGDTLLARITPCLENGKSAFVDFMVDGETGWGSTEYIVLQPKPRLTPEFGYYLARSDAFRAHAIRSMTGTSGPQRVPSDCFSQLQIAMPSESIAAMFAQMVHDWMRRVQMNTQQSCTLAALRDALLPKLLSGDLSVAGTERMVTIGGR